MTKLRIQNKSSLNSNIREIKTRMGIINPIFGSETADSQRNSESYMHIKFFEQFIANL